MRREPRGLFRMLLAIAAITAISGLVQMVNPGWILNLIGAESNPTSRHFFGIVGMFMTLFGGLLWHALQQQQPPPVAVLWASLQKFGAALAVGFGVMNNIFSKLALTVAAFDFLSGALALFYWLRLRKAAR